MMTTDLSKIFLFTNLLSRTSPSQNQPSKARLFETDSFQLAPTQFHLRTLNVFFCFLLLVSCWSIPNKGLANEQQLLIELELPRLSVQPYHKPYVAIWLEDENRQHLATLALWAKEDTWYKDLRQWWRKIGRNDPDAYDAVSGATRLPGRHKITWNNNDLQLEAGTYLLNIEASREEGGRSYHRQALSLGKKQTLELPAEGEFGSIRISLE